ncbi:MAG: SNF2-related protein [Treponema sp.]
MRSFALENLINIFYLKKSFVEGKHPRIELKSGILVQSDKQSEPPLFPSPNDSIVENIKKTRLNKIKDNNGMSNPIIDKEERQAKFESIKAKVLEHLAKLEEEENKTLKKSFMFALLGKSGKGLPVGTIREWKGKKFIKIAPGKWRPKYDSHTRGSKLAISALKKKIVACKDEHEMMQLILENRDRFTDTRGNPLPFVQELYKFIKEEQNSEKRMSPEEVHRNRSEAMKGNQNAKKDGVIVEETKDGKDNTGTKLEEFSDSTGEIRGRGSEESGNQNVQESELGDNRSTLKELPNQSGNRLEGAGATSKRGNEGTRRHKLDLEERLTKKTAKEIRKACLDLLASKTDDQMTEEDKALLRRYEGAGGLNEKGATSKAVLTEYYTPHDVINKVWELVDKYNPSKNKKVLEPSSGIGRFAEGRDDDFTLCEIDGTSSRIARILHPKAEVKEGAFQNLFIKNNSVQKQYKGEKYDVVIGNPPYGAYNDYYKGLGEGAIHDRYEQYFIDRGLDTLKDGGIMAFVVPSGFLRGLSSKGKEAIAKKGKLVEAWRLPKGTFSSTDVGTDIVIIKKEKGNIEDFTNNKYFLENESHVIGHEEDGGNWGGKIVKLPEGKTIEEAIAMIDPQATEIEAEIKEVQEAIDVKISEEEEHKNRSEAMMGNQNAKKDFHKEKEIKKRIKKGEIFESSIGKNMTAEEFNKKYNKNISEFDIRYWQKADWEGVIRPKTQDEIDELSGNDSNFLFDNEKNGFVHSVNYASGNIYQKLDELEKNKLQEDDYNRKKKILMKVLPTPKKLGEFTLSLLENFANKKGSDGLSLVDKFLEYCSCTATHATRNIPYLLAGDVVGDVNMIDVWEYIQRIPVKAERARTTEEKDMAKIEVEKKRQDRKTTAERMFNTWLNNLSNKEKEVIEDGWNRVCNAVVNPDYKAIPLFVEGMNTHKGKDEFNLTEQQVKGVSQLCNKGNGILAYDVGVGKTVTGLIATINQMQTGKAKRPLICVPKSVYKNWVTSARQHFPDVKINELSNFSQNDLAQFMKDGKLDLPENAINICTYEALQKITFKEDTITGDLRDDILESQSIHDYALDGTLLPDSRSQRQIEQDKEKIDKILGTSTKAKDGAVFFEELGIDHITVDELHNFKNIFSIPRARKSSVRLEDEEGGKEERLSNEYAGIQGATSARGMKLFAISQLIQRKNDGKGFFGLSATPFNNSPVEIYSILSLTARNRLKELNIYNLQDFMNQFAELKNDWKVDAKGDIKSEQVMKSFKNLGGFTISHNRIYR